MLLRPSKPLAILILLVVALISAIATFVHWAADKGVASWIQVILIIADVVVLIGFALSFDDFWDLLEKRKSGNRRRTHDNFIRNLINTRKWPLLVVAFANAIMFPASIIPFLSPPAAVESKHHIIEQAVLATDKTTAATQLLLEERLPALPSEAPVVKIINGYWGEQGCQVVYRFALEGTSLRVERVKAGANAPSFTRTGTVIGVPQGYVLNTRSDDGPDMGVNTTFTVDPETILRLEWQDRNRGEVSTLFPCPGKRLAK